MIILMKFYMFLHVTTVNKSVAKTYLCFHKSRTCLDMFDSLFHLDLFRGFFTAVFARDVKTHTLKNRGNGIIILVLFTLISSQSGS